MREIRPITLNKAKNQPPICSITNKEVEGCGERVDRKQVILSPANINAQKMMEGILRAFSFIKVPRIGEVEF